MSIKLNKKLIFSAIIALSVVALTINFVIGQIGGSSTGSLNKGLVGHWKLDSQSYNSTTDRVDDSTPYGNHGTNYGASIRNQGADFNGSSDYIGISDDSTLDVTSAITVAAWVRLDSLTGTQYIVGRDDVDSNRLWYLRWHGDINLWSFRVFTSTGSTELTGVSGEINAWHHFVGVWDGSNVSLYKDGALASGPTARDGSLLTSDAIGTDIGRGVTNQYFLNGRTADVLIYGRALSASEVLSLYQGDKPVGAVLDMPLDTGFKDLSGNGNNGTNSGADLIGQAASFDGTNDYINIGSDASFTMSTEVTITGWVKADSWSGVGRTIARSGGDANGYWLGSEYGVISGQVYVDSAWKKVSIKTSPPLNEWVHAAVTYNGSTIVGYYNGVAVTPTSQSGAISGSNNLVIGAYTVAGNFYNYFDGELADVRIYNRALSQTEITELYNLGGRGQKDRVTSIGTKSKGLVGHWKLNSESEKIGSDVVSNGSFTSDTTSWTAVNSATLSSEAGGQSGNTLKILNGAAAWGFAYQTITTVVGKTYSVNYWHKNGTSGAGRIAVGITSTTSELYNSGQFLDDTDWTERRFYFIATTTTSYLRLINGSMVSGEYTYYDEITLAEVQSADQTPNVNNGTVYGASVRNHGAEFNGTSDWISMGDLTDFEFAGDFTVSTWVKYVNNSGDQVYVCKWTGAGSGSQWWLGYIAGAANFRFGVYTASGAILATATSSPVSGSWYHIVGVRNGTNMYIYQDGKRLGNNTTFAEVAGQNSSPLQIGNYNADSGAYWPVGNISDVVIYNRALSDSEVLNLYQGDKPVGAILDMPLDTGFKDLSGNGNNGTNYGADLIGQAAYFDGTDDYVKINDSTDLDVEAITVELWFKAETITTWPALATRGRWGLEMPFLIGLGSAGQIYSKVKTTGSNVNAYWGFTPTVDVWYHVAFTYDSSDGMKTYVDSVAKNTAVADGVIDNTSSQFLTIGCQDLINNWFKGNINGVRIYNRALSQTEITSLYNLNRKEQNISTGNLNKGLIGQWDLTTTDEKVSAEISSGTFTVGKTYRITARDDADFTTVGSADNNVGTTFTATGTGAGLLDSGDKVKEIKTADKTSYGNHGTVYGATVGSDYTTFDGTDDGINFGNVLNQATNDFSLAIWFKTNENFGEEAAIITKSNSGPNIGYGMNMDTGEKVKFYLADGFGTYVGWLLTTNAYNDDAWHLAVGTADRDGLMKLYMDGDAEIKSTDISSDSATSISNSVNLMIARFSNAASQYDFKDDISNVRIYNRALSLQEIQTLYANGH